jgi:hypothetical protein
MLPNYSYNTSSIDGSLFILLLTQLDDKVKNKLLCYYNHTENINTEYNKNADLPSFNEGGT